MPPRTDDRGWHTVPVAPLRDIRVEGEGSYLRDGPHPELRLELPPGIRGGWLDLRLQLSSDVESDWFLRIERDDPSASRESLSTGRVTPSGREVFLTVELGPHACRLLLSPAPTGESFEVHRVRVRRISGPRMFLRKARELSDADGRPGLKALASAICVGGIAGAVKAVVSGHVQADDAAVYRRMVRREVPRFAPDEGAKGPLLSVLMPVYHPDPIHLDEAIASVRGQTYGHWELCVVDDASDRPGVRDVIERHRRADPRIRAVFRSSRGHICAASNSALELAQGEYVALLDHDDRLHPDALAEVAEVLRGADRPDLIYTDEDHLDVRGRRCRPYFKPDWSPDLLLSHMYTCHLGVYRTELVKKLGGFRAGCEGAQDHDLALRVSEERGAVVHLPRVLYHWRETPQSTAASHANKSYAQEAGLRAVRDALARRNERCVVEHVPRHPGCYVQRWAPASGTTATVIIPTRDRVDLLDTCLRSLQATKNATPFDVIVVSNNSQDPATAAFLDHCARERPAQFSWFSVDAPFNYARLNNLAADRARGDILVFMNNDIEATQDGWLDALAGCAQRPGCGAVGPLLLYPDGRIQHAGIVLGIGGGAAHVFRGRNADDPGYFNRLLGASNVSAVTGACLAVRRLLFDETGRFDEQFAHWFNDVDLCLRLRQRGAWNVLLPQVRLMHHESASLGSGLAAAHRERYAQECALMNERWPAAFARDPFYGANLSRRREDYSLEPS